MRSWISTTLAIATLGFGANAAMAQTTDRGLVETWYLRYLGHPAGPSALSDQLNALRQGTPPSVVEASILAGSEYYHRNGSTPEGFVIALYRDVFGTVPTPSSLGYWASRTVQTGRNAVATQILAQRPVVGAPPAVVVQPAPVTVVQTVPAYRTYYPAPVVGLRLRIGR